MIYTEKKEQEKEVKENLFTTIILSTAITILTTLFIVYGPKSPLFT